ncbi:hypothetical protein MK489_15990 [Myxococcota bacterium]|nr:hypothetical protein [Myxococcota bacterium]
MSVDSPGHVLVVGLGYMPLLHVSATRATYMSRTLATLGWEVSVLTVDWTYPLPQTVISPAGSVERALEQNNPRAVAIDGRLSNPSFDPRATRPDTEPPSPRWVPLRRLRTLRNTLSLGPYPKWAHNALLAARELHKQRPVDVIWAIHGDDSCHAIAHQLHREFGIPWVADFKDAWSRFHKPVALPVQRFATNRRLRTACALTEACEAQAERDRIEFKQTAHLVYSGYDRELMSEVTPEKPGDSFAISYLGSIGFAHDVSLLGETFAALRARAGFENLGIRAHQFSAFPQLKEQLKPVGCASLVESHERVSLARSFSLMRGSDLLLLLPHTARDFKQVGLKEIEYVASGTPILVLGQPLQEFSSLFEESHQVCIALDAEQAADFIESEARQVMTTGRSARRVEANGSRLDAFTWPHQGRRLSEILSTFTRPWKPSN